MADIVRDLKEVYSKVVSCLDRFPDSRDSDKVLFVRIAQEFYGVGDAIPIQSFLHDLPHFESIRRQREKIQNTEGRFPPTTWKVAESRNWNQERWKEALGYQAKKDTKGMEVW